MFWKYTRRRSRRVKQAFIWSGRIGHGGRWRSDMPSYSFPTTSFIHSNVHWSITSLGQYSVSHTVFINNPCSGTTFFEAKSWLHHSLVTGLWTGTSPLYALVYWSTKCSWSKDLTERIIKKSKLKCLKYIAQTWVLQRYKINWDCSHCFLLYFSMVAFIINLLNTCIINYLMHDISNWIEDPWRPGAVFLFPYDILRDQQGLSHQGIFVEPTEFTWPQLLRGIERD